MKKLLNVFALCLSLFLGISCKYDDSELWTAVNDHEERIAKLEILCNQLNTNILSLKTIVTVLNEKDFVTGFAPINENGTEIGYTIIFASGKSITIYHGKDGRTPVIGIRKDSDGIYYWTLNGEWLLDDSNQKIPAYDNDYKNGVTPQLKIEDDEWYVSYDKGESWEKLENIPDDADTETEITYDSENIYITLPDDTILEIPRYPVYNETTIYLKTISEQTVTFAGTLKLDSSNYEYGVIISEESTLDFTSARLVPIIEWDEKGEFTKIVDGLKSAKQYYYASYIMSDGAYDISSIKSFVTKAIKITTTSAITEIGTNSAKILLNWDMSAFDPDIKIGLKFRNASTNEPWQNYNAETNEAKGSHIFSMNSLDIDATYEYGPYYEVAGAEHIGDIGYFDFVSDPTEFIGLIVKVDKNVIKADGTDAATISVFLGGANKTNEATFYNKTTYEDITLTDGKFKTDVSGIHHIIVRHGSLSEDIQIQAIKHDIPDIIIDNHVGRTNFKNRAFLLNHTGLECMFGYYMEQLLDSLYQAGTIPDKAILVAAHSYRKNNTTYIAAPTVDGYPSLRLNTGPLFWSSGSNPDNVVNHIDNITAYDASAGLSVSSVLYDNSTIVVKVRVKAGTDGNYKAGIYLLENGVAGIMSAYIDGVQVYKTSHNNCARYISDICVDSGINLGKLSNGETGDAVFVINIDPKWQVNALNLAATASMKGDDGEYTTCNAVYCPVNGSVPFEYNL